jgi:hypothetical protein
MDKDTGEILYPSTVWTWVWYCFTLYIPYQLPSLPNSKKKVYLTNPDILGIVVVPYAETTEYLKYIDLCNSCVSSLSS